MMEIGNYCGVHVPVMSALNLEIKDGSTRILKLTGLISHFFVG